MVLREQQRKKDMSHADSSTFEDPSCSQHTSTLKEEENLSVTFATSNKPHTEPIGSFHWNETADTQGMTSGLEIETRQIIEQKQKKNLTIS